jgi:hypothetical protein
LCAKAFAETRVMSAGSLAFVTRQPISVQAIRMIHSRHLVW